MIGGDELGFLNVPAEEQVSGSMSANNPNQNNQHTAESYASTNDFASIWHGGFPDEPSLLEEMGIHNTNVVNNLKVILLPMSEVRNVDDNFLVGLLFFCLFAGALLFLGKVRFGMVYMIGIFGFLLLYYIFKFMSTSELSMGRLFTALSYCTIPLAPFVLLVAIFRLRPKSTTICSFPFIGWSAYSATRYIMPSLKLFDSFYLIFIPLCLFYSFLLLLPIY